MRSQGTTKNTLLLIPTTINFFKTTMATVKELTLTSPYHLTTSLSTSTTKFGSHMLSPIRTLICKLTLSRL
jgi:hypothetical protein